MLEDINKLIEGYNKIIENRKQFLLRHNERGMLAHVALEGLFVKDWKYITDAILIQFNSGKIVKIDLTDLPIIAVFKHEIGLHGSKRDLLKAFSILVCHLLTDTDIDDNDIYGAMLSGFELSEKKNGNDSDPDWIL